MEICKQVRKENIYIKNALTDTYSEKSMQRTNKNILDPKRFKCRFCGVGFNTNPSRRRHELHRCRDNNEVSIVNQLQNEKKILYKQIEKLTF